MKDLRMEPYGDRVIVRQIEVEFKTAGGLFLAEIEKDRETMFGRVVYVGDGKYVDGIGLVEPKSKIGDIVVMRFNAPIRVNVKGRYYHVINESNILFRLWDEDAVEKEFKTEGMEITVQGNARVLN